MDQLAMTVMVVVSRADADGSEYFAKTERQLPLDSLDDLHRTIETAVDLILGGVKATTNNGPAMAAAYEQWIESEERGDVG